MATHGAADSYYNDGSRPPPMQPQMQYPPQNYNDGYQGGPDPRHQQPPPNYGQNHQNGSAPLVDGKQTFDQAFKLDKPKYNDLWAGILVRDFRFRILQPDGLANIVAHSHISWVYCHFGTIVTRICCEQKWKCWQWYI